MDEKTFPKIGARDLTASSIEIKQLENASNCYCPECGCGPLDGITGIAFSDDGTKPEPKKPNPSDGDPSVCTYCATLLCYSKDEATGELSLRLPDWEDEERLQENRMMWEGLQKLRIFIEIQALKASLRGEMKYKIIKKVIEQ